MAFFSEQIQNPTTKDKEILIFNKDCLLKINLDKGASVQELTLLNTPIIKDLAPLNYKDTYASAILFPFANRVKEGKYSFKNVAYQLELNEPTKNNAIHGLVYNKSFKIITIDLQDDFASVILEYNETDLTKGFPFTYKIQLTYSITVNSLELKVTILNTSNKEFPFTIGWHPYFFSENLYDSFVHFKSDLKASFDENLITVETQKNIESSPYQIQDKKLDDCFFLTSNKIEFATPNYKLQIDITSPRAFLQLYTPSLKNVIAIEPTTGISNSFNNQIGLETLAPNQEKEIVWSLRATNKQKPLRQS